MTDLEQGLNDVIDILKECSVVSIEENRKKYESPKGTSCDFSFIIKARKIIKNLESAALWVRTSEESKCLDRVSELAVDYEGNDTVFVY